MSGLTTGIRPVSELCENALAEFIAELPKRDGVVVRVGSPRGQMIAQRILNSTDMKTQPVGALHGAATIQLDPELGTDEWEAIA